MIINVNYNSLNLNRILKTELDKSYIYKIIYIYIVCD